MKNCIKLGSLTKIQTGKLDANAATQDGQYSFFTCSKDILRINTYSYECECVLVAGNGDLNVKYFDGKFDAYQRTYIIESLDKEKLLVKYLYYFLNSYVETLRLQSIGGVIKYIKLGNLTEAMIPLPSISEQKKIIDIIEKCDGVINSRVQQLKILRELIESRFIEFFGDPKLNEKGWNQCVISDHYTVKGGKRIPKGMGYADEITEHPYLRASDMKNETILDDDIHYIDEAVFEHIKRYTVSGGDIYLTNVGVNLGMAGVIPEKYNGANLTENAVKLVPKKDGIIDGIFLAHYINSPGIQEYINERKMAVGVPKLAIFRIETMPLLLPPIELQKSFNAFVEATDKSKLSDLLPWKNYSHYLIA